MRLICPSCGAQYEVDESVIPETGRDVQCSNCGHAWFQSPAVVAPAEDRDAVDTTTAAPDEHSAESADEEAGTDAGVSQAGTEPDVSEAETDAGKASPAEEAPEGEDRPKPLDIVRQVNRAEGRDTPPAPDETETPETAAEERTEEPESGTADDADDLMPAATKPELQRRKLDDAVLGVLREEAERENRVRKVEEAALESQPDLGLAAVADFDEGKSHDRVVRVRGDEDDLDDDALVARASRRELLPDIEEIKSTLRATSERGDEPAAMDAPETLARRQRSGFRRGFMTALVLAFIAVLIYVLAPAISRMVPALEPTLTAYVEGVNAARIWLDAQMQSLTESLKSSSAGQ